MASMSNDSYLPLHYSEVSGTKILLTHIGASVTQTGQSFYHDRWRKEKKRRMHRYMAGKTCLAWFPYTYHTMYMMQLTWLYLVSEPDNLRFNYALANLWLWKTCLFQYTSTLKVYLHNEHRRARPRTYLFIFTEIDRTVVECVRFYRMPWAISVESVQCCQSITSFKRKLNFIA